jgi:hypothetical protein
MYLKEINGSLFSISYPTASDSGRAFRRDINIFWCFNQDFSICEKWNNLNDLKFSRNFFAREIN